jgi:hypothetical protein
MKKKQSVKISKLEYLLNFANKQVNVAEKQKPFWHVNAELIWVLPTSSSSSSNVALAS